MSAWPHTVTLYRRTRAGTTGYREAQTDWTPVAVGVQADIQPGGGSVTQREAGREASGSWTGFFPGQPDVREDDGIEVTAGMARVRRFTVGHVGDWGDHLECPLQETAEAFT